MVSRTTLQNTVRVLRQSNHSMHQQQNQSTNIIFLCLL